MSEETTEDVAPIIDGQGNPVDVEAALAEKTEGQEERPEWLPERFKTPEDLAKSYGELEKKLMEKRDVPEKYTLSEELDHIPEGVEAIEEFGDIAKEAKLTDAQFNAVLKFASEKGLVNIVSYEDEMKALGKDKDTMIPALQTLLTKTGVKLDDNGFASFDLATAEGVRNLYKLATGNSPANIPSDPGTSVNDVKSLQKELDALISDPDIRYNASKKQEAERLAQEIAKLK